MNADPFHPFLHVGHLMTLTGTIFSRLLEHCILHGSSLNAVDEVIKQLGDPSRRNPNDLDRAMIGFLKAVQSSTDKSHHQVVKEVFRRD